MPSTPRTAGRWRWGRSSMTRWRPRRAGRDSAPARRPSPLPLSRPPERQLEGRAAPRAGIGGTQIASHAAGKAAAQRQAEAHSGNAARGPGGGFVEGPEDPAALVGGDARAVVLEAQYQVPPPA